MKKTTFMITRDKYGDTLKMWGPFGEVRKIRGVWNQLRNGSYTQTPAMSMHKLTFKELYDYTLRHGKAVFAELRTN